MRPLSASFSIIQFFCTTPDTGGFEGLLNTSIRLAEGIVKTGALGLYLFVLLFYEEEGLSFFCVKKGHLLLFYEEEE